MLRGIQIKTNQYFVHQPVCAKFSTLSLWAAILSEDHGFFTIKMLFGIASVLATTQYGANEVSVTLSAVGVPRRSSRYFLAFYCVSCWCVGCSQENVLCTFSTFGAENTKNQTMLWLNGMIFDYMVRYGGGGKTVLFVTELQTCPTTKTANFESNVLQKPAYKWNPGFPEPSFE